MCGIAQEIERKIEEYRRDRRIERDFNVTLRKSGKHTILMANIYPLEGHAIHLFKEICSEIEEIVRGKMKEMGEVQTFRNGCGENVDLGITQTKVLDGLYMEFYCYRCSSSSFLRIWMEEDGKGRKWISVDLDEIVQSPWFDF